MSANDGARIPFEAWYEGRYAPLVREIDFLLSNRQEAEEVVNEAMLRAWLHWRTIQPGNEDRWVGRVATNLAYDLLRKRRRRENWSLDAFLECDGGDIADPVDVLERRANDAHVCEVLSRLPPPYRTILILRGIEGYSHEEVRRTLQISEACSKMRYRRARLALRAIYEQGEE